MVRSLLGKQVQVKLLRVRISSLPLHSANPNGEDLVSKTSAGKTVASSILACTANNMAA